MDVLSVRSLSSDNVSSEYEVVNPSTENEHQTVGVSCEETGLKIAGNGNEEQLKKNLKEVMDISDENDVATKHASEEIRPDSLPLAGNKQVNETEEDNQESKASYLDEDCILFHGVYYLGCASVNAPRSESEALSTIKILRGQQVSPVDAANGAGKKQIEVVLSLPNRADGLVRLLDPSGSGELANFKIYKILFCVRGPEIQPDRDCFAFTESHESSGIFQCHVFRCDMPDAEVLGSIIFHLRKLYTMDLEKEVKKVLYSFELAFRSIPRSPPPVSPSKAPHPSGMMVSTSQTTSSSESTPVSYDENLFCFNVTLEIKENDSKGGNATVPWDKTSSCFKLRKNLEKEVIMTVTQTTNVELTIERCFGLLLAPGRNVRHSDMHLLDMEGMKVGMATATDANSSGNQHVIVGSWDPTHPHFSLLNEETLKGTRVFVSVAVDLVVQELQEPVRLLLETKARIFPQNDKFWYFGKKVLQETFYLKLREIENRIVSKKHYTIVSLENETSRERRLAEGSCPSTPGYPSNHSHTGSPTLSSTSRQDEEDDDDTDEALLSGSGEVSQECSEHVLTNWGDVLARWRADFTQRPSGLKPLVRRGVPDALRGEVWQLLAGCHDNQSMLEHYRILISKESPQESIIQRDIHRTFPAHEYFKEAGGIGQESLYKISKAYSLYDIEVGYCQGLSFLAAALLLHMPEEQAFCVLCKIMYQYKMRELFKNGFETLHIKFYQLERSIEDLMPDLYDHFKQLCIEAHMYSSQWFLTLFTAKFPLSMVFQVIDLFLSEGELVIFKVALGLLNCCRRDLLTVDFEGVLKYFRVSLPKKYRFDDNTRQLMDTAVTMKITLKKLKKYLKEFEIQQEKIVTSDPHLIIARDNLRLMKANMRLEAENDELAQELVTVRITLGTQLEKTMKHAEILQKDLTVAIDELRTTRQKVAELSDENLRLAEETAQAKELCRKEMERQEQEITKKTKIITDYKTICSQLSNRIEQMQNQHREELKEAKSSKVLNGGDIAPAFMDHQQAAEEEKEALRRQIRNLELELAQTKLSKVESECKVQDLEHQLMSTIKDLQSSKHTWFHKTLSTLTASRNKEPSSGSSPTLSPTSSTSPPFPASKFSMSISRKTVTDPNI